MTNLIPFLTLMIHQMPMNNVQPAPKKTKPSLNKTNQTTKPQQSSLLCSSLNFTTQPSFTNQFCLPQQRSLVRNLLSLLTYLCHLSRGKIKTENQVKRKDCD